MARGDKNDDSPKGFSAVGDLIEDYENRDEDKYISREFQKYGYDLAEELNDLEHKSLYIKLAKEEPRGLLEAARSYVKDAEDIRHKGRLFMWKLKQLKKEAKDKK